MALTFNERPGWEGPRSGLGHLRRGLGLATASGLLVLGLGAVARAGCGDPQLPEVRSLMEYQSYLFHAALALGFVQVIAGLLIVSLMPASWNDRAVPLVLAGLAAVAFLLMAYRADPGAVAPVAGPPGDAGALVTAVLGTAALAGSALVVLQIGRILGDDRLVRRAARYGFAMLAVAAVNAEAASGLLFPGPLESLYALGVIGLANAAALWLLQGLIRASEDRLEQEMSHPGHQD